MATVPEVSLDRQALSAVVSQSRTGGVRQYKTTHNTVLGLFSLWLDRVEQRRCLSQLSDELLRDIGMTRFDAEREAAKWFWQK
jgi:uncharacterized protein YjiS (DUF1127 family)